MEHQLSSSQIKAPSPTSGGAPRLHRCPSCDAATLPLAIAVRASKDGGSVAGLTVPIPNAEQVSRWLKPPEVPADIRSRQHDIWGSTFFMAITIVVIFLTGLMLYAILGPWISVPITLGAMVLVYRRAKRSPIKTRETLDHDQHRTLALRAWDRRMEVWERLEVCPSCGLMSDPVTERTAEWHSVPSLFVG